MLNVNEKTILLEPRSLYDSCITGYVAEKGRVVYDKNLMINACMEEHEWTYTEAIEWLYYNTFSLQLMGGHYPIFVNFKWDVKHSDYLSPETHLLLDDYDYPFVWTITTLYDEEELIGYEVSGNPANIKEEYTGYDSVDGKLFPSLELAKKFVLKNIVDRIQLGDDNA